MVVVVSLPCHEIEKQEIESEEKHQMKSYLLHYTFTAQLDSINDEFRIADCGVIYVFVRRDGIPSKHSSSRFNQGENNPRELHQLFNRSYPTWGKGALPYESAKLC